jgi:hypothetical protein
MAYTLRVCAPTASPFNRAGDVHAANGAPSSEHWKDVPGSLDEKLSVAFGSIVAAGGPESMNVSGGVVSAGVGVAVGTWVAVGVGDGAASTVQV